MKRKENATGCAGEGKQRNGCTGKDKRMVDFAKFENVIKSLEKVVRRRDGSRIGEGGREGVGYGRQEGEREARGSNKFLNS